MPLSSMLIPLQFHFVVPLLYVETQRLCSLLNSTNDLFSRSRACESCLLLFWVLQSRKITIKTFNSNQNPPSLSKAHTSVLELAPARIPTHVYNGHGNRSLFETRLRYPNYLTCFKEARKIQSTRKRDELKCIHGHRLCIFLLRHHVLLQPRF